MSLPKIVTCFPITDLQSEAIAAAAGDRFELIVSDQDRIAIDLLEAEIFCGHAKVPVDWQEVVQQGKLRWIQSSAAGLDHCLVPEVIHSDILVSGCSGLFAPQVAEQTVALLMGLMRRLPVFFRAHQSREYVRRPTDNLEGKQILIIGLGGNGQQIARALKPMCGSIHAVDCFPAACQGLIQDQIITSVDLPTKLDTLLPLANVVIVTLPLSDQNEKLIGERQFEQMQPGTYLVNVGRGSVVDTPSLVRALSSGHLGGAGIDVVDPEPLPEDSPLWEMSNVIITPHVGAQSPLRVPVTIDLFRQNLERFESGQSLLNQVDKLLGFPRPENRIPFPAKLR